MKDKPIFEHDGKLNLTLTLFARILMVVGKFHWYSPYFEKNGLSWEVRIIKDKHRVYVYR